MAQTPPPTTDESPVEPPEGLGFDDVIARLRAVVDRLERGNLSLEDSLRAYESGVQLARRGHALLDGAEKRIELLVRGGPQHGAEVPLEIAGEGGDGDTEDRGSR